VVLQQKTDMGMRWSSVQARLRLNVLAEAPPVDGVKHPLDHMPSEVTKILSEIP
jgi:hypothetical protein